ncbi:MAG TPA: MBL fold metallo-hydrolase [Gaiellaceae bacterium]|jgi:glyoxylase-like metal-dependent hydrolase (beta-lactamase superfamily II)
MEELTPGIRRITFPLPFGIDHVHCYLLRASSGAWTLVDTGLGSRDPEKKWRPVLDSLDAPIERIVVTHMHPDHVGGVGDIAAITGAPVLQGRDDFTQCLAAWGTGRSLPRLAEYWLAHGLPRPLFEEMQRERDDLGAAVHFVPDPQLVEAGDDIDGWRVEVMRGHADGHIVLVRDGVLIAGDVVLAGITPTVGLYPNSRPDPLEDFFATLDRVEAMNLRVAYTGHRQEIHEPAKRAREIRAHHIDRLERALVTLDGTPRTAYEVSLALFPSELAPVQRRFALAESLAHLERLVYAGRIMRADGGYVRLDS